MPRFWSNYTHIHTRIQKYLNYSVIYMHSKLWSLIIYRSLPKYTLYFLLEFLLHSPCVFHHAEQYVFVFCFLKQAIDFNFPGKTCPPQWLGMIGPCFDLGACKRPPGSFPVVLGCFVFCCSIFIGPMSAFATLFYIIQKIETFYFAIPWGDISRSSSATIPSQVVLIYHN